MWTGYYPEGNYVLITTNRGGTNLIKLADLFQSKYKLNCWEVMESYLLVTYNHVISFHEINSQYLLTLKSLIL